MAGLLKEDRVNAVLLVGLTELYARRRCDAHYLEEEGLQPRVLVSCAIIRNACVRRASSGPLRIGPSFRAPDEPEFQTRVLRDVLALFEHGAIPGIEDLRTMRQDKTWI